MNNLIICHNLLILEMIWIKMALLPYQFIPLCYQTRLFAI